MRPVVITAFLLLVVLVNVQSDVTKGYLNVSNINHLQYHRNLRNTCQRTYPKTPCRHPGWYRLNNNHCVRIFLTPQTFEEAEETCKALNSRQPIVHNSVVHDAVVCATYNTKGKGNRSELRGFWMGARKQGGQFKWVDRSALDFTRWNRHQPDNWFFQENCVEVNYIEWGAWNDAACWEKKPFMCIKRM